MKRISLYILDLIPELRDEFFKGVRLPDDIEVRKYKTFNRFLKSLKNAPSVPPRLLLFVSKDTFNPEMARTVRITSLSSPVFIVTGDSDEKDYLTYLSMGIDAILRPPFSTADAHYILNGLNAENIRFPRNNEIVREGQVRLDFLLPSKLTTILGVNRLVSIITSEFGFSPEDSNVNFPLVVDEAISNAIIHGNKGNENLKVHVQVYVSSRRFVLRVEDQGEGFAWQDRKDPTDEENIFKSSGRGLYLIHELMDRVTFKKGGSVIEVEKQNENISDD